MISIAERRPEIVSEWSPRNGTLTPFNTPYGSGKKVVWRCKEGHEWVTSVRSRTQGNNCPVCSGKKVLKGFNDLQTLYPELAVEWSEKNDPLQPSDLTAGSERKVWWKCGNCGQEWQAVVNNRVRGYGCPVCAGKILVPGINDLQTVYPELAEEWSAENELKPWMVRPRSRQLVWWKCKRCGHQWKAVIRSRVDGLKCPACSEKIVIAGKNDLWTTHPKIAAEWHLDYDGHKTPDMVKAESTRRVCWKCAYGHKWVDTVADRIAGAGCPYCEVIRKNKLGLSAIKYYLEKSRNHFIENDESTIGIPVQIYVPDKKVAIEISGRKNYKADRRRWENGKNWLCLKAGIIMIRILSPDVLEFENCICITRCDESLEVLNAAIETAFQAGNIPADVDIIRDYARIMEYTRHIELLDQWSRSSEKSNTE